MSFGENTQPLQFPLLPGNNQGSFPNMNQNMSSMIRPPEISGGVPAVGAATQQQKEMNTATLCRLGQETVQEIVSKTVDMFQLLKTMQLPNGTQASSTQQRDRKDKIQEHLKNLGLLFKRLRLIYDKCNENCIGMEYTHIESLIPYKDEAENRPDERKVWEGMKFISEEHRELTEQIIQRNQHLKDIIDHLRTIIWEVNTMLAMRWP